MAMLTDVYVLPLGSKERTFQYDNTLPSLPVPSLSETLTRYLESVEPLVTEEEYQHTNQIVKEFQNGIGKELHEKLELRASKEKNWLEEWWENYAYLSNREPLLPNCNMVGAFPTTDLDWKLAPGQMNLFAARTCYQCIALWTIFRQERYRPMSVQVRSTGELKQFNMNQYRRFFNTCQVPRSGMDEIVCHFKTEAEGDCPSHVIVIYKGRIYKVEALHPDGGIITTAEWQKQLDLIVEDALEKGNRGDDIACLTSDDRDTWAENHDYLVSLDEQNEKYLHDIESSIFVLDLDDDCPVTPSEISHQSLAGDLRCRWADKALNMVYFYNGSSSGVCNHACYDGIVSVTTMHFLFLALIENRDNWQDSVSVRPNFIKPVELEFVVDDDLKQRITNCFENQQRNKANSIMIREKFNYFGKDLIQKKHQLHPDAFVQMALQLAYYKLHKRPAATYETANTRPFYNGRTETHRSCTTESLNWCLAMLDENKTDEEKAKLLRIACERHVMLLKRAEKNAGCDRHLFGLQVIAFENGIPTPEIFTDPSYIKSGGNGNFILSTSLVGYTLIGGGVMAMCADGYGCFYNIPSSCIWMTLSVRRDGSETSVHRFYQTITEVLLEMDRLPAAKSNKNKSEPRSKL